MDEPVKNGMPPEVRSRQAGELGEMPGNDRDDELPAPPGEAMLRAFRNGSIIAFLISIVFHVTTLMIMGVITMPFGLSGGKPGPAGDIEMAVVSEAELDALQGASVDANAPSVPETVGADPEAKDLMSADVGGDESSSFGDVSDVGTVSGGGDIGSSGSGLGGGGGGSGAGFFGVEARGSRFAFIVDVSGSMAEGEKMPTLRRELISSIMEMRDGTSFVVVPFSSGSFPLGGKVQWRDSTPSSKKWAKGAIEILTPDGGTDPSASFQEVLVMRPRPDAIYFMTDGEFDASVADLIKDMSKSVKTPIHCLCFVSAASEELMKKIAKESGGTYHFIP